MKRTLEEALCRHCGAVILTGEWDDAMGCLMPLVRLDPTPLDQDSLLACVLTGRRLWWITPTASHDWIATFQAPCMLSLIPEGPDGAVTVPEHLCGCMFGTHLPRPPTAAQQPDKPPF